MADDFGPSLVKKPPPVTQTPTVTAAPTAPATSAPPAAPPAQTPAAPDQQMSNGDALMRLVAAHRAAQGQGGPSPQGDPMAGLNQDPGAVGMIPAGVPSGAGQWWSDIQQPKPPDLSRPQTWYDWAGTRDYRTSLADIGKIAGMGWTDSLAPFAPGVMRRAGVPVPNDWSADNARAGYADAWNRAGPAAPMIYGAATALQPLNWVGGNVINKAIGPGVEAALPYLPKGAEAAAPLLKRGLTGGTTASALTATQEAGLGGDPMDILKSAAWAFPQGAALGAIPPRGAVAPADVTAAAKARVQALQDQINNTRIPESKSRFAISPQGGGPLNTNPSIAELLDYDKQMQGLSAAEDPMGASTVVRRDIAKVIGPGTDAGNLIQQHGEAQTGLNNAMLLEKWMDRTGMVGGPQEVIDAAKAEADKREIGDPSRPPFRAIAGVQPPPSTRVVSPGARAAMASTGGALASGISHVLDLGPHETGYAVGSGTLAGGTAADILNFFMRPSGHDPLLQQEIALQYGPMTGQTLSSGADLGRALMYLRQGGQGGPR